MAHTTSPRICRLCATLLRCRLTFTTPAGDSRFIHQAVQAGSRRFTIRGLLRWKQVIPGSMPEWKHFSDQTAYWAAESQATAVSTWTRLNNQHGTSRRSAPATSLIGDCREVLSTHSTLLQVRTNPSQSDGPSSACRRYSTVLLHPTTTTNLRLLVLGISTGCAAWLMPIRGTEHQREIRR